MTLSRRAVAAIGAAASIASLTLTPAQAATASSWTVVFSHSYGTSNNAEYGSVIALSRSDAWAFGGADLTGDPATGTPVAEQWNGTAWHASALPRVPPSPLEAASADSASDIWAVAYVGGSVLHWDGTTWALAEHLPGTGQLTGVTALSPSDVWVFGGGGAFVGLGTWHYNGSTWTKQTGNAEGLEEASALSPTDIWAIGGPEFPDTAIVHYNGTTWQQVKNGVPASQNFDGILAQAPDDVWLISTPQGRPSSGMLIHLTSSGAKVFKLPWSVSPVRLASDGHGGFWISARGIKQSWMVHWSASAGWSRTLIGGWPQTLVYDLALVPGTTFLWGSGYTSANATIWAHGAP